jgi:hypothetical protein
MTTTNIALVTFNHSGTSIKCRPENIAKHQKLLSEKLRKPSFTLGQKRKFPKWNSAMSTQQYVEQYLRINSDHNHGSLEKHISIKDFLPLPCRPSPLLDPSWDYSDQGELCVNSLYGMAA